MIIFVNLQLNRNTTMRNFCTSQSFCHSFCRKLTLLVALIACHIPLFALEVPFQPSIAYYGIDAYKAESQNWGCDCDSTGIAYFANNGGLLTFDGFAWSLTPLKGGGVLRSVKCAGDRIYAGSYEQFGYFCRDDYGQMQYYSLSDQDKGISFANDDIWSITQWGDRIVFQSFQSLFIYDGDKVQQIKHPSIRPLYCFITDDGMFVQAIDSGLYRLTDSYEWLPIVPASQVKSSIVALKSIKGRRKCYLAFTEHDGIHLFDYANASYKPWNTSIDDQLAKYGINRVACDGDGVYYIGTLRNGIYAIEQNGNVLWNCNARNGLGNNCVLGLHIDSFNNLWAMLDDGIAKVLSSVPFSLISTDREITRLGMVYSVCRHNGELLIGSNQGLYRYSLANASLTEFEGVDGQTWDTAVLDDGSAVVSNNGCYIVIDGKGKVTKYPGNATSIKKCFIQGQEVMVMSSYYELRIFRRNENGDWKFSNTIDGFGSPIRQIESDASGALWCTNLSRGIFRLELNPSLTKVEKTEYFTRLDSIGDERPYFFIGKIRGTVVFANTKRLFTFDEDTRKFKPFEQFNHDLPFVNEVCDITPVDDHRFWVSSRTSYKLIDYDGKCFRSIMSIPLSLITNKQNFQNSKIWIDEDGTGYFTYNNGVGIIAASNQTVRQWTDFHIRVIESSFIDGNGIKQSLRISSKDDSTPIVDGGNVYVRFAAPNYNYAPTQFRYRLCRKGDCVESISEVPEVQYAGLDPGRYQLTAEIIDEKGDVVANCEYDFEVPRSTWFSWWAIAFYIAAAGALIWFAAQFNMRRKLRARNRTYEMQKAEQDRKLHEQELLIAEQKRQLLEAELTSKGKELASMALNVYSKQQVIDSMKESLSDMRSRGSSGYQMASSLMRKIESTDTGSSEFWSVFENNFDLIHEHFFRNLQAAYPSLTATDLKFCALLRLNLTTKDIAKFTNISIRGVETARYRLRKKLGLQDGDSLVNFLISFRKKSEE